MATVNVVRCSAGAWVTTESTGEEVFGRCREVAVTRSGICATHQRQRRTEAAQRAATTRRRTRQQYRKAQNGESFSPLDALNPVLLRSAEVSPPRRPLPTPVSRRNTDGK